jgi:hypothetical protein
MYLGDLTFEPLLGFGLNVLNPDMIAGSSPPLWTLHQLLDCVSSLAHQLASLASFGFCRCAVLRYSGRPGFWPEDCSGASIGASSSASADMVCVNKARLLVLRYGCRCVAELARLECCRLAVSDNSDQARGAATPPQIQRRQQVSLQRSSVFRGADPSCSSNTHGGVAKMIDTQSDASSSSTAYDGMVFARRFTPALRSDMLIRQQSDGLCYDSSFADAKTEKCQAVLRNKARM